MTQGVCHRKIGGNMPSVSVGDAQCTSPTNKGKNLVLISVGGEHCSPPENRRVRALPAPKTSRLE